jgi:hypothetical protein
VRAERERPLADPVHDREPRQTGRERHRREQQREQEQVAADRAEALVERTADEPAEDAAAAGREVFRHAEPQLQQPGGRHEESDDPDQTQRRSEIGFAVPIAVHAEQGDPRDRAKHQRQQECDVTAEVEQHVGDPCAHFAADVVQRRGHAARMRPARILRRKRHQARHEVQQQRRDRDQCEIAQEALPLRRSGACRCGRGLLAACRGRLRHRDVLP